MISLTLPTPPSANGIYANLKKGGRVKSRKYKAWRDNAAWEIKVQNLPWITKYPVRIQISLAPDCRGDRDNRIKPTLDALVASGVLADDSEEYVSAVSVVATKTATPGRCVVVITPCEVES